ncbi:MAG: hypothetical protein N3G80_04625 [Candidatus Micrarchaeota archaeon]|nr:hypothetical protein [Candidatus Micrarchaeota archaeon]
MYTSIVNRTIVKKLHKRLGLSQTEAERLQRKFNQFKEAVEERKALVGREAQNKAEEKTGTEQKLKKAKEELAQELANILNESYKKRSESLAVAFKKLAGASLAIRAIDDLDEAEKIENIQITALKNAMKDARRLFHVLNHQLYSLSILAAAFGTIATGAMAASTLLFEGINIGSMGWMAGFALSGAVLMGLTGIRVRHLFHHSMISTYLAFLEGKKKGE